MYLKNSLIFKNSNTFLRNTNPFKPLFGEIKFNYKNTYCVVFYYAFLSIFFASSV